MPKSWSRPRSMRGWRVRVAAGTTTTSGRTGWRLIPTGPAATGARPRPDPCPTARSPGPGGSPYLAPNILRVRWRTRSSPQAADPVDIQDDVVRNEAHRLDQGRRRDEPVEGILVVEGESRQRLDV